MNLENRGKKQMHHIYYTIESDNQCNTNTIWPNGYKPAFIAL